MKGPTPREEGPGLIDGLYQPLDVKTRQFRLLRILTDREDLYPSEISSMDRHSNDPFDSENVEDEPTSSCMDDDDDSDWESIESDSSDYEECSMRCELATFSLDEKPIYDALSYCWTNASPTHQILVNGKLVAIRPNLYNFLMLAITNGWHDWIFVDAICIDQSNLAEKAIQVVQMGDVYRNASHVIAWLGEADLETQKHIHELQDWFNKAHALLAALAQGGKGDDELPPIPEEIFRNVLHQIGDSPYWSRMWISQEFNLAHTLTVQYGALGIIWSVLLNFTEQALEDQGYDTIANGRFQGNQRDATIYLRVLADNLRSRMSDGEKQQNVAVVRLGSFLREKAFLGDLARARAMRLSVAITLFGCQMCSILHDKVYGVLGMTQGRVPIDYEISIPCLYAETLIEGLLDFNSHDGKADYTTDDMQVTVTMFISTVPLAFRSACSIFTLTMITREVLRRFGRRWPSDCSWSTRLQQYIELESVIPSRYTEHIGMLDVAIPKFENMLMSWAGPAYLKVCETLDYGFYDSLEDDTRRTKYSDWVAYIDEAYQEARIRRNGNTSHASDTNPRIPRWKRLPRCTERQTGLNGCIDAFQINLEVHLITLAEQRASSNP